MTLSTRPRQGEIFKGVPPHLKTTTPQEKSRMTHIQPLGRLPPLHRRLVTVEDLT